MITSQLILGLLNLVIVFAESIISLRIVLKMMGASQAAPFVRWVYETSQPLLYPFEGMFPSPNVNGLPFTIEISAIFAIFAYMFVGYLLQEVIDFLDQRLLKFKGKKSQDKE